MIFTIAFITALCSTMAWHFGDQHGYSRRQRDEMLEVDLRDRMAELIEPEDRL